MLLYIHHNISKQVEVMSDRACMDRIWIQINNTTDNQCASNKIFCCFCYMPPADSTVHSYEGSLWTSFEQEVLKYSMKGEIIICGDMNARTGTICDFVPNDSALPVIIFCHTILTVLTKNVYGLQKIKWLIHKVDNSLSI